MLAMMRACFAAAGSEAGRRRGVLLAAGLLLLGTGCAAKPRSRAPRVAVTVATAERRDMPFELTATGTVEPLQSADIGSPVGGMVTQVLFREGDEVRKGQLLFQLDPRPLRATLDQVLAQSTRSRAQAETARLEAGRAAALFERGLLSEAEWEQKRAAAETGSATARADSAAVESARLNLHYASIRAPISGRTGRLLIHEGDYVRPATVDPLVTINQTRPVRVAFTVPVSAVPLVQRYRATRPRVEVRQAGADSVALDGALVFVDNAVDRESGTLLLKGEFANRDQRLVPGQFVEVRLVLYVEPRAIVVPALAVTRGQTGAFVYVMNPDSTVAPRPITVVRTVDDFAVVSEGIRPGETVITDGQLRLSPGARVLVRSLVGG
jgi:multidrug efflux system membrane fusion protein